MQPTSTPTSTPTALPLGSVEIGIAQPGFENDRNTVSCEDSFGLTWHANYASYYDISLRDSTGNVIMGDTGTTKTRLDIASGYLSTGAYTFQVTPYNSNGIAGSMDWIWFNVVSMNERIELSDYLGTDFYSFVHKIDGMRDIGATDGVEFSNGAVTAHSPFDLDCITYIGLESSSNYSICGVYIGQKMEAATDVLTDDGWRIVDGRENGKDYMDSVGNTVFIWSVAATGGVGGGASYPRIGKLFLIRN